MNRDPGSGRGRAPLRFPFSLPSAGAEVSWLQERPLSRGLLLLAAAGRAQRADCWHRSSPGPSAGRPGSARDVTFSLFLCFPGLHPHQTPAPMANPGLYPPPVSMPPSQPPPQQLLAPTYFSPPGVMNFGNPGYPYPPGALPPPPPPHLYSNTQVSRARAGGRCGLWVCSPRPPGGGRGAAGLLRGGTLFAVTPLCAWGGSLRRPDPTAAAQLPRLQGPLGEMPVLVGLRIEALPYRAGEQPSRSPWVVMSPPGPRQGHLENIFGSPCCLRWRREAGSWLVLRHRAGEPAVRPAPGWLSVPGVRSSCRAARRRISVGIVERSPWAAHG